MKELHIDIETYSSIDITSCGAYRYTQSVDFEILLIAYAFGNDPVQIVDLAQGEEIPVEFLEALKGPNVKKHAHSANFERQAFKACGYEVSIDQWHCSAVKAAYCGLPLPLAEVSKALNFGSDKAKLATGKALIRYFSIPCKPTKVNGQRCRNFPEHDLEKWEQYKEYCIQDVEAEREIGRRLDRYAIPATERELYILDQEINDRGILIDTELASKAYKIDEEYSDILKEKVREITGVDNPNSVAQLKQWIGEAIGKEIKSLAKENVSALLDGVENKAVGDVLRLRQMLSKSSIKKYTRMLDCVCSDGRGHGFFQFYGANRTGRWAGRLVQVQNLTRNYLPDLTTAREVVKTGDHENVEILYGDVSDTLSQLIRTAFVADEGKTFAVADFSAIEARVIAWIAGEKWRLDVFKTHGKIYEASAASMFGVPIEEIGKGSDLRSKGKVAELALGFGGSIGALTQMGADKMGLEEDEMRDIVNKWRKASPAIVQLWRNLEGCAKQAVRSGKPLTSKHKNLLFEYNGEVLTIELPSGRKLFYQEPRLQKKMIHRPNGESFEVESLTYMGMDQTTKQWVRLDTYGGKLTENIVQAVARDLLAHSMLELDKRGFEIVMHVHDEAVCEIDDYDTDEAAQAADWTNADQLEIMCKIMGEPVPWAKGLPLGADGYITPYYKKD